MAWACFSAVVLGLGTLVAIYSGPYLSKETGQEKFYAMLLLMISMIIGLGCATDLFNLWIWFEATGGDFLSAGGFDCI